MAGVQWSLAWKDLSLGSLVSQSAPNFWTLVYLILRRQHGETP